MALQLVPGAEQLHLYFAFRHAVSSGNGGNRIRIPIPADKNQSGILRQRVQKPIQCPDDFFAVSGAFLPGVGNALLQFFCYGNDFRLAFCRLIPVQQIQRQMAADCGDVRLEILGTCLRYGIPCFHVGIAYDLFRILRILENPVR